MSQQPGSGARKALVNIDGLLSNVAIKAALGSLAFIPACVVFKGTRMRFLTGGLGMGFGAGIAWAQSDLHLRHPQQVPMPKSLPDELADMKASLEGQASAWRRWLGV
eukprot:TRINITY_DN74066_c0_g1_i1.p2 TRINITY_DN74066_c0_g1~~TRINITY_DN74066_c0_g1_i1.p2  ORF type:complete len:107 (+),score=24.84 TRINITY_DN74066_c0_g1_i1:73-393(+)